ncbi:hypothetical protein PRZ48_011687 [Zasmidium cellare]|uniref:Uncharacterized protein n=1 Tax=Zasmidium cellare TaxID=395010 RepID=A0ABR0E720_ZASCE|nr:hypothetical protein PRZ48_011687 [Zasmidium cellare]
MAKSGVDVPRKEDNMKQNIINMTQTMINIKEETDRLLQETHRILQEKATSNEKPLSMPETQHFIQDYVLSHKPELEAIDPNAKGSKLRIRRLLAEMLHQAIDAVSADIMQSVHVQMKKRGSASSTETLRRMSQAIGDQDDDEDMVGEMSEDEGAVVADVKGEELGRIVGEEMVELRDVVKEAVDDALW